MFDAMILTAIIAGLALPGFPLAIEGTRFPRAALASLLIVPLFLTTIVCCQHAFPRTWAIGQTRRPMAEAEFAGVSDFIKAHPGPALCETLLLCYAAGKPQDTMPLPWTCWFAPEDFRRSRRRS